MQYRKYFHLHIRVVGVLTVLIWAAAFAFIMAFTALPASAAPGDVIITPSQDMIFQELPVEVETELGPAGSLKQAPLWKEIAEVLKNPYEIICTPADNIFGQTCVSTTERRPGFGTPMPPLNVYPYNYVVQTGQPLRLRTSDGEVSWDQPGPLFAPGDLPVDELTTREIIGYLVVDEDNNLVVSNPDENVLIPPDGTIVAVPGVNDDGMLIDIDGNVITELEEPVNENHFFKNREAAELLGKSLFWDMQIGSDGVQSCGSCHFHAGVDNRTRNQLNPGHLGGDLTLQVTGPNTDVVASDFPFHKLADPDIPGEPLLNPGNVVRDSNDVMSSMGVSIFKEFVDIPPIGNSSFGPPSPIGGIRPLLPDIGNIVPDPIPVMQGLRRIEPRHTPTFHAAAFNFDNFWDGRARFNFNGGSVFGATDPFHHIFVTVQGQLQPMTHPDEADIPLNQWTGGEAPVRIKFSSLASQAVGPPLSEFEMSFLGRNWGKIGKKMLQGRVVPLANQLVAVDDSVLGPYSNQGGSECIEESKPTAVGMPGLCTTYPDMIEDAFYDVLWNKTNKHLRIVPDVTDGFDSVRLDIFNGPADAMDTDQVTQMEANFSLFFGLAVQAYEQLTIPDDTPFDRFMDENPRAAFGVAQPGEQGTLLPEHIPGLVGPINLNSGFGEDELFGFDIFAGSNITAALPIGSDRNPDGFGSNPFLRTARCMLCHLGPEQSDHTINVNHGILISSTELELPPPGASEPTGPLALVTGFVLAEEVEEPAQDGVEVENRNFSIVEPATVANYAAELEPYAARIGLPSGIAFQDNGIYNVGLRPTDEDIGRGGDDPFGWPLALASLALKNLAGPDFEPCDTPGDICTGAMPNFDPDEGFGGGLYEETGGDMLYPGTTYTLQSINPGLEVEPALPLLPDYLAEWTNNLPAAEAHPQIDELAFAPNTITEVPVVEFGENQFGSDQNCIFVGDPNDPEDVAANDWGPRCPNVQSAVPNNFEPNLNGTYPFSNRVARNGAFKVPHLRNVELTGPYFHTGSYLTLRQVTDFYIRGGDFPITNSEDRDPNLVDVRVQAFGFGGTSELVPINIDGVPDSFSIYDAMPDSDHPNTPEPATSTPENAIESIVKFLLSLTDDRVKFERAPFDHPEIFVPIDGTAPENTGGRAAMAADPTFRQVPASGSGGIATALPNFLDISSTPVVGVDNDHFDR